nr:hypothetical protein CFP56_59707 [Quercus suber]
MTRDHDRCNIEQLGQSGYPGGGSRASDRVQYDHGFGSQWIKSDHEEAHALKTLPRSLRPTTPAISAQSRQTNHHEPTQSSGCGPQIPGELSRIMQIDLLPHVQGTLCEPGEAARILAMLDGSLVRRSSDDHRWMSSGSRRSIVLRWSRQGAGAGRGQRSGVEFKRPACSVRQTDRQTETRSWDRARVEVSKAMITSWKRRSGVKLRLTLYLYAWKEVVDRVTSYVNEDAVVVRGTAGRLEEHAVGIYERHST